MPWVVYCNCMKKTSTRIILIFNSKWILDKKYTSRFFWVMLKTSSYFAIFHSPLAYIYFVQKHCRYIIPFRFPKFVCAFVFLFVGSKTSFLGIVIDVILWSYLDPKHFIARSEKWAGYWNDIHNKDQILQLNKLVV